MGGRQGASEGRGGREGREGGRERAGTGNEGREGGREGARERERERTGEEEDEQTHRSLAMFHALLHIAAISQRFLMSLSVMKKRSTSSSSWRSEV